MREHRLHRLDELRAYAVVDQMARGERAALAAMGGEAHQPGGGGLLDVGVGAHDQRRFPAELHHDALQRRRGLGLEMGRASAGERGWSSYYSTVVAVE